MKKLFNCECGNRFPVNVSESPEGETVECDGCSEEKVIIICPSCENILAEEYNEEDCPVCGAPLSELNSGCSFLFFLLVFSAGTLALLLP